MNLAHFDRFALRFSLVLSLLAAACGSDDKSAAPPATGPVAQEQPPPSTTPQADPLVALVESERAKQSLVGFAMAYARPDGKIVSAASGDAQLSPQKPFGASEGSAIGSITKTFTAVVVHQLVDEGKLSVEASVDQFLPEQPRGDRMRVRHLLSHTSGMPDYIEGILAQPELAARIASPWAPAELVAVANAMPALGEPGAVTGYANTNYVMLGMIIEKVTGISWEENVKTRIIDRVGLPQTRYAVAGTFAHGYVRASAATPEDVSGSLHVSVGWAAGGLVSSAEDLAKYARALFDGKLMSAESLTRMTTPIGQDHRGGLELSYGMGMILATVDGKTIMGHQGDLRGYVAFIGMNGGNVVAATTNTDGADVLTPSVTALFNL